VVTSKKSKSGSQGSPELKKAYSQLLGSLVESLTGKVGRDIINMLLEKSNLNEFLIAKKLNLTINQTRNILYKLSDNRIVSFNRKKDRKKGWYTYFWTLDVPRTLEYAQGKILENIKNLSSQKKNRENRRFYICKICNIEVSEETALINSFTCTECGTVYELNENKELIVDIDSRLVKYNDELEVIKGFLDIERKRIGKKIDSKNKREKEKRKVARKVKADAKKKESAKLIKKSAKKINKK
jgi:transcription factor E